MDDLGRLTATEDVRRVMAHYVYCADHHRWDELAALFTPDAPSPPTPWRVPSRPG